MLNQLFPLFTELSLSVVMVWYSSVLGPCYKFIVLALFPQTLCTCKNIKPRRKNPETPRLKFGTLFLLRLSPLKNFLHCLTCVWLVLCLNNDAKEKGWKSAIYLSIISAWEKVWENSFALGRIVRKQVYSAKSGQIFKPLALIKVGSCDSIVSYVLFIMALYLNTNAFQKLPSRTFFWKVLETMQ